MAGETVYITAPVSKTGLDVPQGVSATCACGLYPAPNEDPCVAIHSPLLGASIRMLRWASAQWSPYFTAQPGRFAKTCS